jgi:flavin reductase (DIM6/NTAB) family NADH-FMN oxidoreductase RutF
MPQYASHTPLPRPALHLDQLVPGLSELLPEGIAPTEFRAALSKAVTPVTVLATDGPHGRAGITCSAVCSVCDTPPTILVCVNRKSYANGVIRANGVLTVNWLSASQRALSQAFAGVGSLPMEERFACGAWEILATGAPYSTEALLSLDCHIATAFEVGSHSIFLAHVVATSHAEGRDPLAYCRRAYTTTQPAVS